MKRIKVYDSEEEATEAVEALDKDGIQSEVIPIENNSPSNDGQYALIIHVGNFIRARDVILDLQKTPDVV